jgi:hypothetical protein
MNSKYKNLYDQYNDKNNLLNEKDPKDEVIYNIMNFFNKTFSFEKKNKWLLNTRNTIYNSMKHISDFTNNIINYTQNSYYDYERLPYFTENMEKVNNYKNNECCHICRLLKRRNISECFLYKTNGVVVLLHPQQQYNIGRVWVVPQSHINSLDYRNTNNYDIKEACETIIYRIQKTMLKIYNPVTFDIHQLSLGCSKQNPSKTTTNCDPNDRHIYFDIIPRYLPDQEIVKKGITFIDTKSHNLINPLLNNPFKDFDLKQIDVDVMKYVREDLSRKK